MPEGEVCLSLKFMSKTLAPDQQNWSTQEREAFAAIWALDQCEPFVKGRELHVYCDHQHLPTMMNNATIGKLRRWAIRLSEYRPEIHHIRGSDNIVADFMSRHIEDIAKPDKMFYCCLANRRRG